MSALRKALEDGRDDAKFIETVPTARVPLCRARHAGGGWREWFGHPSTFQVAAYRERDMAGHRGTHGWRSSLSVRVSALAIPARPDAKLAADQPSRPGTPSEFFA